MNNEAKLKGLEILRAIATIGQENLNLSKENIDTKKLSSKINEFLNSENINTIIISQDPEFISQIVSVTLICIKPLSYSQGKPIFEKLKIIAGTNSELLEKINQSESKLKSWSSFSMIKSVVIFALVFGGIYYLVSPSGHQIKTEKPIQTNNGDLNKEFAASDKNESSKAEISNKELLLSEGWSESEIENGAFPNCYNFKPKKGKIDNKLEISVGGGTDVALKLMELESNKCIRYVFINSNTTYKIKNIPEGKYYLKIAYGKDWVSKVIDGKCTGKFSTGSLYEKGEDVLDYRTKQNGDHISIPSFKLQLDVYAFNTSNSFDSEVISEATFND